MMLQDSELCVNPQCRKDMFCYRYAAGVTLQDDNGDIVNVTLFDVSDLLDYHAVAHHKIIIIRHIAFQTLAQDLIEVNLVGDPEEVQVAVQEAWGKLSGKRANFGCKAKIDFSVSCEYHRAVILSVIVIR